MEADPNMIKENYEEYIVEFRVTIVDPMYSRLLRDPESVQLHHITRELTDRVSLQTHSKCQLPAPSSPLCKHRKPDSRILLRVIKTLKFCRE